VPLVLFAVPNQQAERNDYEIAIPRLGSLILTHSLDGEIQPLTAVPREDRPPVAPVFFAFRVMVGIGMLMLLLVAFSLLGVVARAVEQSAGCCAAGNCWRHRASSPCWPAGTW
jgi:cytochrome bd-type quinol oxidase subunit 1